MISVLSRRCAGQVFGWILAVAPVASVGCSPAAVDAPVDEVTGTIEVVVEDHEDGRSVTRHFIDSTSGRFELEFPDGVPNRIQPGAVLSAVGTLAGDHLIVDSLVAASVQALTAAAPTLAGEQKIAVLLVNFQDNTTQPVTSAAAMSLVFGQLNDYYREASYQQTFLSGSTFGWYTLPILATCNTSDISKAARLAASEAGIDLSPYSRVVFMYPRYAICGVSGTAVVGGTEAFINGGINLGNIAHEMGHSFGLQHSNDLDCDRTPIADTCVVREYADLFDTMGNSNYSGHYNAFQKERLGWLNGTGTPTIATVQASGRFLISPFELTSTDAKGIKVLKSTDAITGQRTWYYVEYRQTIGFDATLASIQYTNVAKGVLVHLITEGDARSSRALDMTPNSTTIYDDRNDSALVVGKSFNDPDAGLTITLTAADSTGATVEVAITTSPPPPPATTLSAQVTTSKASYLLGDSVSMTTKVVSGTQAVVGASVSFQLTKANGTVVLLSATTDGAGLATTSYRLNKRKDPRGTYRVDTTATSGGLSASASATFAVQ